MSEVCGTLLFLDFPACKSPSEQTWVSHDIVGSLYLLKTFSMSVMHSGGSSLSKALMFSCIAKAPIIKHDSSGSWGSNKATVGGKPHLGLCACICNSREVTGFKGSALQNGSHPCWHQPSCCQKEKHSRMVGHMPGLLSAYMTPAVPWSSTVPCYNMFV